MREELITFETAKLAKEKGFNVSCRNFYRDNGELLGLDQKSLGGVKGMHNNSRLNCNTAPTQSLLQRWLREERKIIIEPFVVDDWNVWGVKVLAEDMMSPFYLVYDTFDDADEDSTDSDFDFKKSFEDALEFGLQKGLDNSK